MCARMPSLDAEEFSSSDSEGWEEQPDSSDIRLNPCLFCEASFPSAEDIFHHCQQSHNFDIVDIKCRFQLDCFSYIKMINYIRLKKLSPDFVFNTFDQLPWNSEELLQPVLEDDLLLQYDIEDRGFADCAMNDLSPCIEFKDPLLSEARQSEFINRIKASDSKSVQLEEALHRAMQDIVKMRSLASNFLISSVPESNTNQSVALVMSPDEDESYFNSYSHFSIHEEMLKDKVRTGTFHDAIFQNAKIFKDKVVLDVGCGTSILSLFAAKAGAKHVFGVDQSDIIYQAMDIVRENNLEDKITLLKGRAEDIELPVSKVDIIISEWIGYFLLFESMLDTVLFARDKWLAKDGQILPDRCCLYLAAVSDSEQHQKSILFWSNVYGFKMSCMKRAVIKEASVESICSEKIISTVYSLKEFDLYTSLISDVEFKTPFSLKALHEGAITAFVGYFDVSFEAGCEFKIKLSTSPSDPVTHWKQTVFHLEQPHPVLKDEEIIGEFSCFKNRKYPRSLIITISIGEEKFRYLMQ